MRPKSIRNMKEKPSMKPSRNYLLIAPKITIIEMKISVERNETKITKQLCPPPPTNKVNKQLEHYTKVRPFNLHNIFLLLHLITFAFLLGSMRFDNLAFPTKRWAKVILIKFNALAIAIKAPIRRLSPPEFIARAAGARNTCGILSGAWKFSAKCFSTVLRLF